MGWYPWTNTLTLSLNKHSDSACQIHGLKWIWNEWRIRKSQTRRYQENGRDGNSTNANRNTTKDFGSRHVLKTDLVLDREAKLLLLQRRYAKRGTQAGFSWQIGYSTFRTWCNQGTATRSKDSIETYYTFETLSVMYRIKYRTMDTLG